MKICVRNNVFETNSSSMHSIAIRNPKYFEEDESLIASKEDVIESFDSSLYFHIDKKKTTITRKEYDKEWHFVRWPFEILTEPDEKFVYAYASLHFDEHELLKLFDTIKENYFPNLKKIDTGKDEPYVDENILSPWLEANGKTYKDFIEDNSIIVVVDGDEYNIYSDAMGLGLITPDAFTSTGLENNYWYNRWNEDDEDDEDDENDEDNDDNGEG